MASGSNGTQENGKSSINVVDGEKTDDRYKTARHPRWTRQETLVLIEGKKIAEEKGRKGRRSSSVFGSDQVEPKWDYVSSHCRRNGVNRGPVQCRKRWSNLLSDFKKIKTWDSKVKGDGGSFWMMRSDLRRERKLPGFFDREVYDVLDGKVFTKAEYQLALVTTSADENNGDGIDGVEAEDEDEVAEGEETRDGLFSEFGQDAEEIERNLGKEKVETDDETNKIPSPVPISENKRQPGQRFSRGSEFQEGVKRRRQSSSDCENTDVDDLLIKVLERNTNLLNAQLEEQKSNRQLDREQQKDQHNSLMAALSKITDALEKIANKL
ncbi:hypothetical protein DH2020_013507 [Rehmannia glutinosa]|uniref:Myb-like domain-containing protein n=1 Tax=Rehmannia glutinosa TaxID=99300 RepID=A0ABR0X2G3_REHGL